MTIPSSEELIIACTTAASGAQIIKCIVNILIHRPVDLKTLVHTGGMPSSHSSLVTCLTTGVGLIEGFHTTLFAIALGFSSVVMYDAAGLRRSAGKMAGVLNKISKDIYMERPDQVPDHLRELLGHTPFEVLVGALLGIGVAAGFH